MNCAAFREHVDDYLDGQLDEVQALAWREHRASCAACRGIADGMEADHAAIAAATRSYAAGLRPPSGGREEVLRRARMRSHRWWAGPAAAALLMVGIIIASHARAVSVPSSNLSHQKGVAGQQEEPADLLAELTALKAWQDDLARSVAATGDDHLWRMVACTYLPAERVPSAMTSPGAVTGDAPASERRTVVTWQRTTRRGDRTTMVDFRQCDDGSVHVEHRTISADEETVTCLDAASWDLLMAGHGSLCRELGLLGSNDGGQAGWPLPALGRLVKDARLALLEGVPAIGLAQRLMALRLASHVASLDELETAMRRALDAPLPLPVSGAVPMSGPQLQAEIRRLMEATGAARLTTKEWHAAMRCLPAIRRGLSPDQGG